MNYIVFHLSIPDGIYTGLMLFRISRNLRFHKPLREGLRVTNGLQATGSEHACYAGNTY
jgi:hypothetical protein